MFQINYKMKNKLILFVFVNIFTLCGLSQTTTSVANGNWTNPLTWSCTCVPTPGANVTINHNVVLNTSFGYSTGSITINSGGSLLDDVIGRDMWVNGGAFTNNGNVDVHYLLNSSGTFINSGTITARAISNSIGFTNTGIFQNIDSMLNNAVLINNGSFLNLDSITNNVSFVNNGICTFNQFTNNGTYINNNNLTFTDITNNGILTNSDSINGLNSMWNLGKITNNANAYLTLNKSLLNRNLPSGTASINNNGRIKILDSYYNYDTISGTTGGITVQDSSVNYGYMIQSWDFCDYTSIPSPNIDYNFGTVSSGITYCINTNISVNLMNDIVLYPNPANNQLNINYENLSECEINIFGVDGKKLLEVKTSNTIDISTLTSGFYFVYIKNDLIETVKKIQIIK